MKIKKRTILHVVNDILRDTGVTTTLSGAIIEMLRERLEMGHPKMMGPVVLSGDVKGGMGAAPTIVGANRMVGTDQSAPLLAALQPFADLANKLDRSHDSLHDSIEVAIRLRLLRAARRAIISYNRGVKP
jgi:hypothetical protein